MSLHDDLFEATHSNRCVKVASLCALVFCVALSMPAGPCSVAFRNNANVSDMEDMKAKYHKMRRLNQSLSTLKNAVRAKWLHDIVPELVAKTSCGAERPDCALKPRDKDIVTNNLNKLIPSLKVNITNLENGFEETKQHRCKAVASDFKFFGWVVLVMVNIRLSLRDPQHLVFMSSKYMQPPRPYTALQLRSSWWLWRYMQCVWYAATGMYAYDRKFKDCRIFVRSVDAYCRAWNGKNYVVSWWILNHHNHMMMVSLLAGLVPVIYGYFLGWLLELFTPQSVMAWAPSLMHPVYQAATWFPEWLNEGLCVHQPATLAWSLIDFVVPRRLNEAATWLPELFNYGWGLLQAFSLPRTVLEFYQADTPTLL